MLTFFRRGITAKLMLILLGLVLVAIIITGFGAGGMGLETLRGLGGGGLATVDGQHVTVEELNTEMGRQLDIARRQQPEADMTSLVRQGLVDEIVDEMIAVTGAVRFGQAHGLAATREMMDREITKLPIFQDATGKFDDQIFRRWLEEQKMSEAQVRKELARQLIQRQLMDPVMRSAALPKRLATQYAALLLESRTGSVGFVPAAAMAGSAPPSDADVAAAYRSNIARYTIPERRVLRYALFDAAQVAAQAKANEAEIQAAYKQHASEYAARESRTLQQVVLQSEAAARAFAQKLAAGTSFEAAAQQAGFGPGDIAIGDQSSDSFAKISSPAAAAAAFSAAKGAVTAPIKSPFGWHIVKVADIKQIAGKPIEAVRAQLVTEIEQRKTQEALSDLAARMEESIGSGASFEDIVTANKLAIVETPPVTAAGIAPGAQVAPEVKPLLESGFALSPGDDPTVETVVPNQRFALLSVARVIPAAAPPLAQIKDRVRADLAAQRAFDRARAVATAILAKINAGTPPAQAFAEAKLGLKAPATLSGTRREVAQEGADPARVAMFAMAPGKARMLPAPQGQGWMIVHLAKIDHGDASKAGDIVQAVRGQFVEILGQEYAAQFRKAILAGMKVKRHDQAIAEAKAKLASGAAR